MEDVIERSFLLQIISFFSPTEIRLSDFRKAVKVFCKRCVDTNIRKIAKELRVRRDGVDAWKAVGGTLLLLASECGMDVEEAAGMNTYLRMLVRGPWERDGQQRMSDDEYRKMIDMRMAEVTNGGSSRKTAALQFLNSLSQNE